MDNGPQFSRSKILKALLEKFGICRLWSNCFYHPQSNFSERTNKTIGAALRSYIGDNHRTWDALLPEITLALRTAVNSVTGYSPVFLNHAREFVFSPSDYKLIAETSTEIDPYRNRCEFIDQFLEATNDIHTRIYKSYARNKRNADKHRVHREYEIGDRVYLRNYVKSDKEKGRKFERTNCRKTLPFFSFVRREEKLLENQHRWTSLSDKRKL